MSSRLCGAWLVDFDAEDVRVFKRLFDMIASGIALVVLAPVLAMIGLAIKFESRGPIFFRQWRVGKDRELFLVYKFRTMVDGAADKGPPITVAGDVRVTAVGRVLRRFELDELPTLINVFRGEMSIVGPRPELPKYLPFYLEEHNRILSVRPGMTDPGTLVFRDEAKLLVQDGDPERLYVERILPEKLRLNMEYIERCGMVYDLAIIVRTLALIAAHPKG